MVTIRYTWRVNKKGNAWLIVGRFKLMTFNGDSQWAVYVKANGGYHTIGESNEHGSFTARRAAFDFLRGWLRRQTDLVTPSDVRADNEEHYGAHRPGGMRSSNNVRVFVSDDDEIGDDE